MSEHSPSRRAGENAVSKVQDRSPGSGSDGAANESGGTPRVEHVQKEWEHRNFYVPAELDGALEATRTQMAEAVQREYGGDMAVTRHFYPVMIRLGLEAIGDLSAAEFADQVDEVPGVSSDEFER
jgi:hypothetical protein